MDFTPGNQPSRPSLLSAAHSPRRATPQFPNTRGAHSAPGLRKPRGAGGEVPRVRGALRLTPPRSPRIVSGTSRPPRRGLPGAGCRRQAPLPPRGPSLLNAEGPPAPHWTAESCFSPDAAARRAPPLPRPFAGRPEPIVAQELGDFAPNLSNERGVSLSPSHETEISRQMQRPEKAG